MTGRRHVKTNEYTLKHQCLLACAITVSDGAKEALRAQAEQCNKHMDDPACVNLSASILGRYENGNRQWRRNILGDCVRAGYLGCTGVCAEMMNCAVVVKSILALPPGLIEQIMYRLSPAGLLMVERCSLGLGIVVNTERQWNALLHCQRQRCQFHSGNTYGLEVEDGSDSESESVEQYYVHMSENNTTGERNLHSHVNSLESTNAQNKCGKAFLSSYFEKMLSNVLQYQNATDIRRELSESASQFFTVCNHNDKQRTSTYSPCPRQKPSMRSVDDKKNSDTDTPILHNLRLLTDICGAYVTLLRIHTQTLARLCAVVPDVLGTRAFPVPDITPVQPSSSSPVSFVGNVLPCNAETIKPATPEHPSNHMHGNVCSPHSPQPCLHTSTSTYARSKPSMQLVSLRGIAFPCLERIEFHNMRSPECILTMANTLATFPTVTSLNFHFGNFYSDVWHCLFNALAATLCTAQLKHFSLISCKRIGLDGCIALGNTFAKMSALQSIEFWDTQFIYLYFLSDLFTRMAEDSGIRSLRSITLREMRFDRGVKALSTCIGVLCTLEKVDKLRRSHKMDDVDDMSDFVYVDRSKFMKTDNILMSAGEFDSGTKRKRIRADESKSDNARTCGIRVLIISGCTVLSEFLDDLCSGLPEHVNELETLDLSGNEAENCEIDLLHLPALLRKTTDLRELTLQFHEFDSAVFNLAMESLHCHKHLETLLLGGNPLISRNASAPFVGLLTSNLQRTLVVLDLSRCRLNFTFVTPELVKALATSSIAHLLLGGNRLEDRGVALLSQVFMHPSVELETLDLSGNRVSSDGLCEIQTALTQNTNKLHYLMLFDNFIPEKDLAVSILRGVGIVVDVGKRPDTTVEGFDPY
eukprot:CFRG0763T1